MSREGIVDALGCDYCLKSKRKGVMDVQSVE